MHQTSAELSAAPSFKRRVLSFVRKYAALLFVAGLIAGFLGPKAQAQNFRTAAKQAILIDVATGSVIFAKNADQKMLPASMVKILTMAVVFEALGEGRVSLDDEFNVSENAWRTGGAPSRTSSMFAKLNSDVKLSDLIKGVVIQSGNDACIVIAENMAGSEEAFAGMMNAYAKRIGMKTSHFGNSTGLPHEGVFTTARDLATLAEHVIRTYPEKYGIYSEKEFKWGGIRQFNRNPLLGKGLGVDGMKTGYTAESGYGIVISAERDGQRLILVMNGMKSKKQRAAESRKLLEWGYRSHQYFSLYEPGEYVGEARLFGGAKSYVPLVSKSSDGIRMLIPKGARGRLRAQIVYTGPVPTPVQEGQDIGFLKVWRDKVLVQQAPLVAAESVGTGALHQRALDAAQELIIGLLR